MKFVSITKENYNQVAEIYKEGLATKMATFETQVPNWDQWNKKFLPFCRIALVLKNEVLGWATLTAVSPRAVYLGVAEVTIYIKSSDQQKGLGKLLLDELITQSEQQGIWSLQASIFRGNDISIQLHKKCGFRVLGYKEKIARRDGIWHDTFILERRSRVVGVS